MKCDDCANEATFFAYAAYDLATNDVHPHHARYPAPIVRACATHLASAMVNDALMPGGTRQWLVAIGTRPLPFGAAPEGERDE